MSSILVKMPVPPHRQKVLVGEEGAETEMRLQQWANKKAFAEGLKGEEATARRNQLMQEAISEPEKHGIIFMSGKPIPLEGMEEPEGEVEVESAPEESAGSAAMPSGQMSLEDFVDKKSFDPHPGDAMLKAIRYMMGR